MHFDANYFYPEHYCPQVFDLDKSYEDDSSLNIPDATCVKVNDIFPWAVGSKMIDHDSSIQPSAFPSQTTEASLFIKDLLSMDEESSTTSGAGEEIKTCNKQIKKKNRLWTKEEDAKIMELVNSYSENEMSTSEWLKIAKEVSKVSNIRRSGPAAQARYKIYLKTSFRLGRFTGVEKKQLQIALVTYPNELMKLKEEDWIKIAKEVPTRSWFQVKKHAINHLA